MSRGWTSGLIGCLLALLGLSVGCANVARPDPGEAAHPVKIVRDTGHRLTTAGDAYSGVLDPGEAHLYPLDLLKGESLLLEVEQREVDVQIEARGPDDSHVLTWDTPTHRAVPERLCLIAKSTGRHDLILSPYQGSGRYSIRLVRRRKATEEDRACFTAAIFFMSAIQGEAKQPIEELERAADLWQRAGEPLLAGLAWRESASRWLHRGPPAHAVDRFEKALAAARQAASAYLEVSALNRLGLAWIDLGELTRARARLEEARDRARAAGDAWGHASALTNLGRLDDLVGMPHAALGHLSEALTLWRQIGDPIEIAQALQNMATAYGVLDHHDRALDQLAEALELTRGAADEDREASVLMAQGWIHYLRGQPAEGIPALIRVLQIRRRNSDRNGEAVALDRLGTLLRESGNPSSAERAYRDSLALSIEMESPYDAAGTIANLGCLDAETGQPEEARAWLEDARTRYDNLEDPRAISHVEFCLAQAAARAGDVETALGHIERALSIVDRLREAGRQSGHYYRPIWLWQEYAELQLALLLRKFRETGDGSALEKAFEAADLARARTLFEQVVETRVGVRSAADESLLAAERQVQDALNEKASEIGEQAEREVRRLKSELDELRAEIRLSDPRYPATLPRPITVSQAQDLLSPRTAILSYVLGDERSYLLTLDGSGLSAHELAPRDVLDRYAESFYRAVQESRADRFQWWLVGSELSRRLLPKRAVAEDVERLIIVPDGLLHYVPFAALASVRDGRRPLVEDFQISYVPSLSVLAGLRERGQDRDWEPVALFADPVFTGEDERFLSIQGLTRAAETARSEKPLAYDLPRLAFTADEALAIASLVGPRRATVWRDFDATRDAVLEADLKEYGILHFATHAWIDDRFPELSGLFLSQWDPTGRRIDSELRLHDIHGLELDAELTVLSGCETALGKQVRGNGVEGFAHGFLYAGSSRVLVSQWKVDDKATSRMMPTLYRSLLLDRVPPAEALRRAQIWLRSQPAWEAPYYWAPFILQGEN